MTVGLQYDHIAKQLVKDIILVVGMYDKCLSAERDEVLTK